MASKLLLVANVDVQACSQTLSAKKGDSVQNCIHFKKKKICLGRLNGQLLTKNKINRLVDFVKHNSNFQGKNLQDGKANSG